MIKRLTLFLAILLSLSISVSAQNIRSRSIDKANKIKITDSGSYYTGTQVEAALQEIGAGTTLDTLYLRLDGTTTPTADITFGDFDITNAGDIALDTISSDSETTVTVNLGFDAGDDFRIKGGQSGTDILMLVEGNTGNVGIGTPNPSIDVDIVKAINPIIRTKDTTNTAIANLFATDSSGRTGTGSAHKFYIVTQNSWRVAFDLLGNVGIGTNTFGTNAAQVLAIENGTAPASSPANIIQLFAEDVASSSELRVRDEAGNTTTLSPHPVEFLDTMPVDKAHISPYAYYSRNDYLGKEMWIDLSLLAFEVQRLSGKKIITIKDIPRQDWNTNQDMIKQKKDAEINRITNGLNEIDILIMKETNKHKRGKLIEKRKLLDKIPKPYTKKPIPKWIKNRINGK